jgi:6,7-dimethyl-8-ribityllumazine synthase
MKKKICIVVSNYYPVISKNLLSGANKTLKKYDLKSIKTIYAPGVFEIPIIISKLIKKYDAFIALGCVIKGQTPHFYFISNSSINGIMNLSILYKKPIGNGILTCNNKKQALDRSNPLKKNKGGEAAKAIISIIKI